MQLQKWSSYFEIPLEFDCVQANQHNSNAKQKSFLCTKLLFFFIPEIDFPTPALMNAMLFLFLAADSRVLDAEVVRKQRRRTSQRSD